MLRRPRRRSFVHVHIAAPFGADIAPARVLASGTVVRRPCQRKRDRARVLLDYHTSHTECMGAIRKLHRRISRLASTVVTEIFVGVVAGRPRRARVSKEGVRAQLLRRRSITSRADCNFGLRSGFRSGFLSLSFSRNSFRRGIWSEIKLVNGDHVRQYSPFSLPGRRRGKFFRRTWQVIPKQNSRVDCPIPHIFSSCWKSRQLIQFHESTGSRGMHQDQRRGILQQTGSLSLGRRLLSRVHVHEHRHEVFLLEDLGTWLSLSLLPQRLFR
ncbi:unnamed protein product [Mycena citricolor]|uniref:Uncharacterized protein n=1 Tax=Mycena citricolor TaxID=2018698 RepID=A0AAD2K841_9AGAR|nr:unnamed protein product [Mycena citricolor]